MGLLQRVVQAFERLFNRSLKLRKDRGNILAYAASISIRTGIEGDDLPASSDERAFSSRAMVR